MLIQHGAFSPQGLMASMNPHKATGFVRYLLQKVLLTKENVVACFRAAL